MVTSATGGLSPETREQVLKELTDLRAQRVQNTPRPGETDSVGDSADQAAALEAHEIAARLDRRIAELEALLEHGPSSNLLPDGTVVTLRFSDGDEETFRVVTFPGDAPDLLTSDSPLGLALVGHKDGEEIRYRTPRGPATATVVSLKTPN